MIRKTMPLLLAVVLAVALAACKSPSSPNAHGHDHAGDHNHHAAEHGHSHGPVSQFTLWNQDYELFGEVAPGGHHDAQVLMHLTQLKDFSALSGAKVEMHYKLGGGEAHTLHLQEKQPGVFSGEFKNPENKELRTRVSVDGKVLWWPQENSDLVVVGKSGQAARPHEESSEAPQDHHDHEEIELLKEQQWSIPFATAAATQGVLEPTKEVLGHVEFPPSSTAQLSAPLAGKILPPEGGFPNPGQSVQAGQILARIAPTLQSADQLAQLNLAVSHARTQVEGTRSELARQKRLAEHKATSQRSLEQAQREYARAQQALKAAKASQRIYKSGAQNSLPVRSPISGILTNIRVRLGELAATGQVMFRVSNTKTTWLVTHIPVQWMGQLQQRGPISVFDDAARKWERYQVASEEGQATQASLLNVAVQADRNTQVVDVLYAIHENSGRWLEGAAKRVLVPVGQTQKGVVIPRSAVVHQRGMDQVFVQVDGEHFVARTIRVQLQQGDKVLLRSGIEPGERIVVKGAAVVALAARSDTAMGHGHLH